MKGRMGFGLLLVGALVLQPLLQAGLGSGPVLNAVRKAAAQVAKVAPAEAASLPRLPVGELADRRTRNSKTERKPDGTMTTTVFTSAVNYRDARGKWQPINSNLTRSSDKGYSWANGANSFRSFFKKQLDADYLRLDVGGRSFSMSLEGASSKPSRVQGSRVTYGSVLPSTDLRYDLEPGAVKESLVLNSASAPTSYRFLLKAPPDTHVAPSGTVLGAYDVMVPGMPGPAFVLSPPQLQDSPDGKSQRPAERDPVTLTIDEGSSGSFALTMSVDPSWLRSPGRRFPVQIDPSLTIQPDAFDLTFMVCKKCTASSASPMDIGADSSIIYRGALQFDLGSVPVGAQVTSATLGLWVYSAIATSSPAPSHEIDAHIVTSQWSTSSTSTPSFDPTVLSSFTWTNQRTISLDLTGAVQNWISGAKPNDGVLLLRNPEQIGSGGVAVYAATDPATAYTPRLTITYTSNTPVLQVPDTLHSNGAELHWQYDPLASTAFQKFEVHRSATTGFTPTSATLLFSTTDASVHSFRDTTAAPGRTFSYKVVANSTASQEVRVTLPPDGQAIKILQPGPDTGKHMTIIKPSDLTSGCQVSGSDPTIAVGSTASFSLNFPVWRGLIAFDLHDVTSQATVTSASLTLFHPYHSMPVNAATVEVHRVTRQWDAGTAASCTGATWNQAQAGLPWSTAGGDFDPSQASSVTVPANEAPTQHQFDITSLVQQWISGQAPNLGLVLKYANETPSSDLDTPLQYESSDWTYQGTANRPKLTVNYNENVHAIAPTVSVSAPAPGAMVSGSTVTLSAAASSPGLVSQVQFFVDGTSVGTASQAPWQVTWNSAGVANGGHTITATATDSAGNSTTSAVSAVTVNNYPLPTTAITAPASNAAVIGTVTVNTSNSVASGLTVSKVELYVDGALYATSTALPWSFSWNTLDPTLPSFDGSHTLTSKVYDSSGLIVSSAPITVTVANTAGTIYQGPFSSTPVPQTMSFDPSASSQLNYGVNVTITNISGQNWNGATTTLRYRWYLAGSSTSFTDSANLASLGLAAGQTQTTQVNVSPPTMPDGMDSAHFVLRFDVVDSSGPQPAFFADKGNPPLDNTVIVNKALQVALGLEHYYQYTQDPVGAGITHMVNVANGNSLLRWVPWTLPGRGLASMVELTYNSREDHSDSPMGNNWSLAISSLTRFGDPIEVHPTKADSIAGRTNRFISFVDADGTPHTFTGQLAPDGTVFWSEPAGVHLYLRQFSSTDTSRWWALTRPDRTTFFYNQQGFPTFVTDKNGNSIAFTLTQVAASDDPGGPGFHVTAATDAGGRSINLTYYDRASAKKPQVRGKVRSITDHDGHEIDFFYYDDGNLLRITQRGGQNPDGTVLADRSWTFTYTTSSGSSPSCVADPCYAPAIANFADRLNPDSKTPSQSTRLFSVIDPIAHETQFAYFQTTGALDKWKISGFTDRAGNQTTFAYDDTNLVTTVSAPLTRITKYSYDATGQVTSITDPLGQTSSFQWSSDLQVVKLTEPDNASTSFSYNDNGDLTSTSDQLGNTTTLAYQPIQVDGNDVSGKWRTGRTIPHIGQLSSKSDPLNHAWQFFYDPNGNLTQLIDPLGSKTTSAYNSDGTLASTTDPLAHTTQYTSYDSNGLPTTSVDPLGNTAQTAHDSDGLTLWVQDPNHFGASGTDTCAYRDCFSYDVFNRLFTKSSPLSTSEARGQLIFTDLRYDPNDNLVASYSAHQGSSDSLVGATVTTSTYDAMDRATDTFAPPNDSQRQNEQTHYVYDAAGRAIEVVLPNGIGRSDQAFRIDYQYDLLDRVTAVKHYQVTLNQNPSNLVATLTSFSCYNSAGNRTSVTSPAANLTSVDCSSPSTPFTTRYQYDSARHLRQVTDPDGHVTKSDYDATGNVIDTVDALGNQTFYTYDADNRLTKIQQPFDTSASPIRYITGQITYDAAGNKLQTISARAFDAAGGHAPFTNYVTSYQYDADNRLVRTTLPADANTPAAYIHSAYDPNGNLIMTSLADPNSDPTKVPTPAKTLMTYWDPGWIMTSSDNVNPTLHFKYDASGRQVGRAPETNSGSLNTQKELDWSYYPDGSLATRKGFGGVAGYFYDADGSLIKANTDIGVTDTQASPVFLTASYDSLDRVVKVTQAPNASASTDTFSSFTYDLNGNVLSSVQNAQEGLTTKPGRTFFYDYDQANWLMDECDSSGTTLNGCRASGSTSNCTGSSTNASDECISEAFTASGQESARTLMYGNGAGGWRTEQQTGWTYFANRKLATMTSQNGGGTVIEAHSMGYLDPSGVYLDGNPTLDHFKLQTPNSASPCYSSSPTACTAAYSYDARDRVTVSKTSNDASGASYSTSYHLKVSGDVHEQVNQVNGATTSDQTFTYNAGDSGPRLDHITESVSGKTTYYSYDADGNVQCVSTATITAPCTPTAGGSVPTNLLNFYVYDPLNRFSASHTFTGAGSGNQETDNSTYSHDPLDRVVSETESHKLNTSSPTTKTTTRLYIGLTSRLAEEDQNQGTASAPGNPIAVKTYAYDPFGHRIALTDTEFSNGTAQTPNSYAYGYNVQGSVSTLLDANGNLRATYGYTPYGQSDSAVGNGSNANPLTLTQGDDTDPNQPLNQYRFMSKRFDTGAKSLDTGARLYSPDTGRFFQQDLLYGSLNNLGLTLDPLTQNRYSLIGGNPLSFIEWDGHVPVGSGLGNADPQPTAAGSIFANYTVYAPNSGSDQSDWRKYLKDPCTSNLLTYLIYCRPQEETQAADGTEVSAHLTQGQCPAGPELCIGITINFAKSSKQGSGGKGTGGGSGSVGLGAAAAATSLAAGEAANAELQAQEEAAGAELAAQGAQGESAAVASQVGAKVPYTETDLSQMAAMDRVQYSVTSGRNIAVAEYQVEVNGQVQTRYIAAVSKGTHSEKLIYNELIKDGVDPRSVTRIYSELEPCSGTGMPNCAKLISTEFPNAQVTYSFDYGSTIASRRAGLAELQQAQGDLVLTQTEISFQYPSQPAEGICWQCL